MLRLFIVAALVSYVVGGPTGKIVGGEDTTIEQYPHQISLQEDGWHNCGGSIIGPRWILTAGHCTVGRTAKILSVRVGTSDYNKNGVVHQVKTVITHPEYKKRLGNLYDYALLELEEPIQLGSKAKVIALPDQDEPVDAGTVVTITGWGALASGGMSPKILQVVQVKVVDQTECNRIYGFITDQMLCAGTDTGGKDSCQGDSGGPLITGGKVVGVVSFGVGCGLRTFPGVYARVANQRNWIKSVTGI